MSRYYDDYPAYVSVADRKRQIQRKIEKLRKQGQELSPIVIEGRLIAKTFWGKAWCTNIESYHDYSNRLPRARSYVRHGAVIDLQIEAGRITALVQGSELYEVVITIQQLKKDRWESIKQECGGKINSLIDLIQGKLSDEVIALLCRKDEGLFPAPNEIRLDCNCPDWADLCKHLAAVLYAIGAKLDKEPELFFLLRGVDQHELFNPELTDNLTGADMASDIADDALADIFGIDLDGLDEIIEAAPLAEKCDSRKKTKIKSPEVIKSDIKKNKSKKNVRQSTVKPKCSNPKQLKNERKTSKPGSNKREMAKPIKAKKKKRTMRRTSK
jgi:uncharacterized Zn finger protein